MKIELTSTAFQEGSTIPREYTGDGPNVSPPLQWRDAPPGTESFALVCEDPDAPRKTWDHWVLFNIPASARELRPGVAREPSLPEGAAQGTNDFGTIGYSGPAPPAGKPHRYRFKLYALDRALPLKPGATKQQLLQAMAGHILAEGHLTGAYGR